MLSYRQWEVLKLLNNNLHFIIQNHCRVQAETGGKVNVEPHKPWSILRELLWCYVQAGTPGKHIKNVTDTEAIQVQATRIAGAGSKGSMRAGTGFVHSGVSKALRILAAAFRSTCLMRRCQGDSAVSLEVHGNRTSVDGHTIEHRELQLGTQEKKTTMRWLRCWNRVQRVCGISIPGDTRSSTRGESEQPPLMESLWSGRLLWRPLKVLCHLHCSVIH